MPTKQKHPENIQDSILFKNLVQQMEESLMQKYSAAEVQKHLEPFEALVNDHDVWDHTLEGLAVFSTKGKFKVEGRVDTLIVEAVRIIAVRVTNLVTGNTQKKDLTNPRMDDLLDDMGELVTKMGGQVMVLPTSKMPTEKGLAAIFRY